MFDQSFLHTFDGQYPSAIGLLVYFQFCITKVPLSVTKWLLFMNSKMSFNSDEPEKFFLLSIETASFVTYTSSIPSLYERNACFRFAWRYLIWRRLLELITQIADARIQGN